MKTLLTLCALAAVWSLQPQESSVANVQDNGFQVKFKVAVEAKADRVYDAFTDHISEWWDKSHTYSGDSGNLTLETRPHGWLIEKLPGGGFVKHMNVVYLKPGEAVRLQGGLGPLQEHGVSGSLTVNFKPNGDGCVVDLTYNVGGYWPGGRTMVDGWAPAVGQVLKGQIVALKRFAESRD